MDPKSCWWKHEEVSFQGGGFGNTSVVTGKAEDVVAMINQTMIFSPGAYLVETGWSAEDGCCIVRINAGLPFYHHCISPSFTLKYNMWDPMKIVWARNSSTLAFPPHDGMVNTGFKVLLEAVFASVVADVERVVIHPLGHDLAAEALCEKILANRKITRCEFLNQFKESKESNAEKTRTMNLCCKLLENCTHIQELLFENLKTYDDKLVEKLFVSIGHNQGLETIDLRDDRFMTTWSKCEGLAKEAGRRGPMTIAPLVLALTRPSNRISSSLRNLHLGGAQLSSDSVMDLAKALPSLRIQKLSLRACGLDKTALVPLLRGGLAKNMDLRELDLSHNLFCTEVIEQLCQTLTENKMLQWLVIEYCKINVEHLKCLAATLPDIKSLRYLLMDGNKFTHTPMYYGLDGITAELQGQFEFVWARPMNVESETGTFECPWNRHCAEPHSLGATILANAMEANTSLFEVKIGEFGFSPFSMSCCSTPPHAEHWSQQARDKYKAAVDRNYKKYQEMRSTRMQQAVVRIATLALDKLEPKAV